MQEISAWHKLAAKTVTVSLGLDAFGGGCAAGQGKEKT
jgi:hypothetical protein